MPVVTQVRRDSRGTKPSNGPVTTRAAKGKPKYRSAWDLLDAMKVLIYGRSGTGKTTLWATFPKPILALVMTGGGKKPEELKSLDPSMRSVIDARIMDSPGQVEECIEEARDGRFETVVLDHVSGLEDMLLMDVLGMDELPEQKFRGLANKEQYGQVTMLAKDTLRKALSLDQNVVLIAQERSFAEDGGQGDVIVPYIGPGVMPRLADWCNRNVSYICQTCLLQKEKLVSKMVLKGGKRKEVQKRIRVKGVDHCLRTGKDTIYMTKFRVPRGRALPDVIRDPSYDDILKVVRGEWNEGE